MAVRVLNVMLGFWMLASAFLWPQAAAQFHNEWLVGLLVMGLGLGTIFGLSRLRWVNFALGLWLFLSALALPHPTFGAFVNQLLVAVLVVVTSLYRTPQTWPETPRHA